MKNKIVIAIDGPAGAGKTTIAKALSNKLHILYFNTGALYRALALKCLQDNLDPSCEVVANKIAQTTKIEVVYANGEQHVLLDNADVTDQLSSSEISYGASQISVFHVIREKLINIQRNAASEQSVIVDGRDIGSIVLPQSNFKFYLDADVKVRAERRFNELSAKGISITYDEVLEDMKQRDFCDKTRAVSPLVICDDAIVIDCTNLTIKQVVSKMLKLIKRK